METITLRAELEIQEMIKETQSLFFIAGSLNVMDGMTLSQETLNIKRTKKND